MINYLRMFHVPCLYKQNFAYRHSGMYAIKVSHDSFETFWLSAISLVEVSKPLNVIEDLSILKVRGGSSSGGAKWEGSRWCRQKCIKWTKRKREGRSIAASRTSGFSNLWLDMRSPMSPVILRDYTFSWTLRSLLFVFRRRKRSRDFRWMSSQARLSEQGSSFRSCDSHPCATPHGEIPCKDRNFRYCRFILDDTAKCRSFWARRTFADARTPEIFTAYVLCIHNGNNERNGADSRDNLQFPISRTFFIRN